jgi:hypothetical protein
MNTQIFLNLKKFNFQCARDKIDKALTMKIIVIWDVTPCHLVSISPQRLEETSYIRPQSIS